MPLALPLLLALVACSPDGDRRDTAAADTGGADTGGADSADPDAVPDEARLLADVFALASEAFGGRAPGTEGGLAARAWVQAAWAAIPGLEAGAPDGGWTQPFTVRAFESLAPASLALDGTAYQEGNHFVLFQGSGSGEVEAEVVFAGYGLTVPPFDPTEWPDCPLDPAGYDDYGAVDVTGRVALVLRHVPLDDDAIASGCPANEAALQEGDLARFGYKAANAAIHGAAAMLLVTDWQHTVGQAESGTLGEDYEVPDLPAIWLDRIVAQGHLPDLRAWADAVDATLAPASTHTGVTAAISAETAWTERDAANVIARLPGGDRADETVVVGAHFDHLGTDASGEVYLGADDNASGSAALLELARVLAARRPHPARTVVFAAFDAEELGLIGSSLYVGEPPLPLEDTVAMLSLDMVGLGDGSGLEVYGASSPDLAWIADLLDERAEVDFPALPMPELPASDHAPFRAAGVPAVLLFTAGEHATYHTPLDVPEDISGSQLRLATHLALGAVEALADGWDPPEARVQAPEAPAPSSLSPLRRDR